MFERIAYPDVVLRGAILGPITLVCSILVASPVGRRGFEDIAAFCQGSLETLIGRIRT